MHYILLLFLLSFPAYGQTQIFFEEVQPLTRGALPTNPQALPASASKPLLLTGYTRYRVTVCPESGQSLTGTGTIRLYVFVQYVGSTTGKWAYRPELDQKITVTDSADRCQSFGLETDVRKGYLLPATIGVGVTGGTTVTVRVDPDNF